jgi:hypothetical protein
MMLLKVMFDTTAPRRDYRKGQVLRYRFTNWLWRAKAAVDGIRAVRVIVVLLPGTETLDKRYILAGVESERWLPSVSTIDLLGYPRDGSLGLGDLAVSHCVDFILAL